MHKTRGIDWDDLRYILAVAEHRSLAAAARALGVNHTTVLRRVNAFEEAQGLRLFDRLVAGYTLTAGGEQLLAAARQMAGVVAALERRLAGQDLRLEGTLRVATTDTMVETLLPPVLASFRAAHPGIILEIVIGSHFANLTKRDADVAIRPAPEPPETLVGRRICSLGFALYASPEYLAAAPAMHAWIGPDDTLAGTVIARWLRQHQPGANIAVRANSFVTAARIAAAGLGVAPLPCYLGDVNPGLVRALPELGVPPPSELWVLTHEDLRTTARVRVFTDHVAAQLTECRGAIEG